MGASRSITYAVTVADGKYAFTRVEGDAEHSTLSAPTLLLKADIEYTFDCSEADSIPLLSITEDGVNTVINDDGDTGEQSVDGVTYYLNDEALEDAPEGDDATTQFKAGLALGAFDADDNALGFTSLYFTIDVGSLAAKTMYYYDADAADMGGTIKKGASPQS